MATLEFTFPDQVGETLVSEIESRAIIEDGEVVEVQFADLNSPMMNRSYVTLGGEREKDVMDFLYSDKECRERIEEISEEERLGRVAYDREMACALRAAAE